MERVSFYLDNAATTALDPLVMSAMYPYFERFYGNASMGYQLGNVGKVAIEDARATVRDVIGGTEGEIFFTSGGTEGNNLLLQGLVMANDIEHVITSRIEHKSVLGPLSYMTKKKMIALHYVPLDERGHVDMDGLADLLRGYKKVLVSLMHGNNEVGNVTDIAGVSLLCERYGALFHTDMVQTLAYYPIDLASLPIDAVTCSAHKLHGPKGIGFVYVRKGVPIVPIWHGGAQEKKIRPGTENVPLIVGMGKALSLVASEREKHHKHVGEIKRSFIKHLREAVPSLCFHGACADEMSLPNIVNIGIPTKQRNETFLLHLDVVGIQASAGSACMSGTHLRSHVLEALGVNEDHTVVRFSFGKYNLLENVPVWTKKIATLIGRYLYT